jgi:hypothetical protein
MRLPSGRATKLLTSRNSDEPHLATRTPARSETQSEVHSECDGVRRRRVYRPIETDWQVCLDEVSFEEAVLIPNGPVVVHQGRKSPIRAIYVERQSCSRPPAVSEIPNETGMNGKSGLPRRSCIYEWDQFQVERHAAASLEGDAPTGNPIEN